MVWTFPLAAEDKTENSSENNEKQLGGPAGVQSGFNQEGNVSSRQNYSELNMTEL